MISKELLSEVLGLCCGVKSIRNSEVVYWFNCIGEVRESSINIYELAHKCKEWALNYMVDKEIQSTGCIISSWTHTGDKGHARILIIDEKFIANTEPEAIFKACQYIMENKCGS